MTAESITEVAKHNLAMAPESTTTAAESVTEEAEHRLAMAAESTTEEAERCLAFGAESITIAAESTTEARTLFEGGPLLGALEVLQEKSQGDDDKSGHGRSEECPVSETFKALEEAAQDKEASQSDEEGGEEECGAIHGPQRQQAVAEDEDEEEDCPGHCCPEGPRVKRWCDDDGRTQEASARELKRKRGAEEGPDAPGKKRARFGSDFEAAGVRLEAVAERARQALLVASGPSPVGEAAQGLGDLELACNEAQRKQQALQAQWEAEQGALVAGKAKLRALELAKGKALESERQTGAALEEFERIVAHVGSCCSEATRQAAAVMVTDEAEEVTPLQPGADARLAVAVQRLQAALRQKRELTDKCSEAETRRSCAEARLAALQREREEEEEEAQAQRRAAAEASVKAEASAADEEATHEAQARATELQSKVDKLEANAADEAALLAELERHVAELQEQLSAEQRLASELELRCTQAALAGAPGGDAGKGELRLDLADPGPFLTARTPTRLHVSSAQASQLSGEYRLLDGGWGGWPAYKAAAPLMAFLLRSSREGGHWVFSSELSDVDAPLARSLQVTCTALPQDVMGGSWTRGAWGTHDQRVRITILAG